MKGDPLIRFTPDMVAALLPLIENMAKAIGVSQEQAIQLFFESPIASKFIDIYK